MSTSDVPNTDKRYHVATYCCLGSMQILSERMRQHLFTVVTFSPTTLSILSVISLGLLIAAVLSRDWIRISYPETNNGEISTITVGLFLTCGHMRTTSTSVCIFTSNSVDIRRNFRMQLASSSLEALSAARTETLIALCLTAMAIILSFSGLKTRSATNTKISVIIHILIMSISAAAVSQTSRAVQNRAFLSQAPSNTEVGLSQGHTDILTSAIFEGFSVIVSLLLATGTAFGVIPCSPRPTIETVSLQVPLLVHLAVSGAASLGSITKGVAGGFRHNLFGFIVPLWAIYDDNPGSGLHVIALCVFAICIVIDIVLVSLVTFQVLQNASALEQMDLVLSFLNLVFKPFTFILLMVRVRRFVKEGLPLRVSGLDYTPESTGTSLSSGHLHQSNPSEEKSRPRTPDHDRILGSTMNAIAATAVSGKISKVHKSTTTSKLTPEQEENIVPKIRKKPSVKAAERAARRAAKQKRKGEKNSGDDIEAVSRSEMSSKIEDMQDCTLPVSTEPPKKVDDKAERDAQRAARRAAKLQEAANAALIEQEELAAEQARRIAAETIRAKRGETSSRQSRPPVAQSSHRARAPRSRSAEPKSLTKSRSRSLSRERQRSKGDSTHKGAATDGTGQEKNGDISRSRSSSMTDLRQRSNSFTESPAMQRIGSFGSIRRSGSNSSLSDLRHTAISTEDLRSMKGFPCPKCKKEYADIITAELCASRQCRGASAQT